MITEQKSNTAYFAEDFQEEFSVEFDTLKDIIQGEGYKVRILEGTSDFYCHDYMPVQVDKNEFVQFNIKLANSLYTSDYKNMNHPDLILLLNHLPASRQSNIVLEGGDLVCGNEQIIITDNVFRSNLQNYPSKETLSSELEGILQTKIIVIPGHPEYKNFQAKELIRFIGNDTVLIHSSASSEYSDWIEDFCGVLTRNSLDFIEIPGSFLYERNILVANYLDFLQVGNLIIFPQFGLDEDDKALSGIRSALDSTYKIIPYDIRWIYKIGGSLNRLCWTILS